MSAKVRIALALVCAVLAVLACQAYAQEARRQEAQLRQETLDRYGGEVVALVVATHQLEAGNTVKEADVTLKEWVSELAPEGALVSLDDVLGKTLSSSVATGQVLTQLALVSSDSSFDVPSGTVAVSLVLSDKLGLVSGIDTGSRIFAYRVDDVGAQLVSASVTVVSLRSEGGALSSSKDVTIAAQPDDIPAILEAAAKGTLRLVVPASNVTAANVGVIAAPSVVEPEVDIDAEAESKNELDESVDKTSADEDGSDDLGPLEGDANEH